MTNSAWASPAPWAEGVARSRGRTKYNSIGKLRAKLRRLAIVRRLRHDGDIHQRGLQRQLAEEMGVVRSVICEDFKHIMAAGGLGGDADKKQWENEVGRRRHQPKEKTMGSRCTVRFPDVLGGHLQKEADAQGVALSDLIRRALERLLDSQSDHGAGPSTAPELVAMSALRPHDCVETVLARLPGDVCESIMERARVLDLPVSKVVTSMLIVQLPPSQTSPQVSGTARPQTEFLRWQEINRQRQETSEVALLDTAPSSSAPILGTS